VFLNAFFSIVWLIQSPTALHARIANAFGWPNVIGGNFEESKTSLSQSIRRSDHIEALPEEGHAFNVNSQAIY